MHLTYVTGAGQEKIENRNWFISKQIVEKEYFIY